MLGKNIRYLRKINNMSQDTLAEKLGYKSYTTIQKWEMGTSEPPIQKLKELSNIFDVDMNSLVNKNLKYDNIHTKMDNVNAGLEEKTANNKNASLNENELLIIHEYRKLSEPIKKEFHSFMGYLVNKNRQEDKVKEATRTYNIDNTNSQIKVADKSNDYSSDNSNDYSNDNWLLVARGQGEKYISDEEIDEMIKKSKEVTSDKDIRK